MGPENGTFYFSDFRRRPRGPEGHSTFLSFAHDHAGARLILSQVASRRAAPNALLQRASRLDGMLQGLLFRFRLRAVDARARTYSPAPGKCGVVRVAEFMRILAPTRRHGPTSREVGYGPANDPGEPIGRASDRPIGEHLRTRARNAPGQARPRPFLGTLHQIGAERTPLRLAQHREQDSTGCRMAFLSWLMSKGHAPDKIAQAMVPLGDSGTLAQLYQTITGDAASDAWPAFLAAVQGTARWSDQRRSVRRSIAAVERYNLAPASCVASLCPRPPQMSATA